ncbi:MAG: hypothetical protein ABSA67_10180 [Candidatus Brocadiia bacterium]|jgi:hypothetical protein
MAKAKKPAKKAPGGPPKLAAEIKVEARDFTHAAASLGCKCALLKGCTKAILKRIEKVKEVLDANIAKGGLESPRAGMLFGTLEQSRQESQKAELERIDTAVSLANFVLESVGAADLKAFRAGCRKVSEGVVKKADGREPAKAAEPDGKSQAAGDSQRAQAAG